MKRTIVSALVFLTLFPVIGTGEQKNSQALEVVDNVKLNKYIGLWYEIARIPNRFQKSCARKVTAKYELREDGRLNVINKCVKENGKTSRVKGIAKIVDPQTNAKLKVSFVQIFGFSLFWGDYWIIALDENYEYAVVGHPKRKYGWILSRSPELSDSTLRNIFKIIEKKGYDSDRFKLTEQ
ncbi:MAG: lipocalin family protein [Candidatus Marinimicrobia bacterium]|nr:lipocalin family protein [Candidatus Neomarinimicrobiota bacterium]